MISQALIALVTHLRIIRKKKILLNKKTNIKIFCFFTIAAALKEKNLLPEEANSFFFKSSPDFGSDSRHIHGVRKINPFWLRFCILCD